ncbi:MAG TPA: succinate dehydrogenase assembly factor 2 [Gammaproteobacteria bacterium]|uniref:FAD assembly factor SdhE n=1 Tax=Immundisolibacter sp. TaxID=1934948 RepID=UPI000E960944|nr:succinate dehydrogenase assembly factor 2 [Gammaproteobacteria bacterium]HCZ49359.1 succinate dehydrogenase assembly factor 2 [Gammaproteobacteria bacterium]MCH78797.1 succinate dehydrogenase assembly factor 2 [Gammaproteobacteria bacterium]
MLSDSTLRWRCRRGKKELDVLLARFLERHLAGLDAAQRAAFERLLALEDEDLLDRVLGRVGPDDPATAAVLDRLNGAA